MLPACRITPSNQWNDYLIIGRVYLNGNTPLPLLTRLLQSPRPYIISFHWQYTDTTIACKSLVADAYPQFTMSSGVTTYPAAHGADAIRLNEPGPTILTAKDLLRWAHPTSIFPNHVILGTWSTVESNLPYRLLVGPSHQTEADFGIEHHATKSLKRCELSGWFRALLMMAKRSKTPLRTALSISVQATGLSTGTRYPEAGRLFDTLNGLILTTFLSSAVKAYSYHHHLVLRPEDVWFSILVQLNVYINEHAEELRR